MAILRGYGDDMATMSQKISHGKTASKQARGGGVLNCEVSCDWRFQPANSLLKQEGTSACKS